MARSYKAPWVCDRNPMMKNYANRVLRRNRGEIPSGCWYRKYSDPWSISDWCFENPYPEADHWLYQRWPRDLMGDRVKWRKQHGNQRAHRPRMKRYEKEEAPPQTDIY